MVVLDNVRKFLWLFVELGFLSILSVILIFLMLGDNSGVFIKSVTENVMKFTADVPTPSLIGLGVLFTVIYMIVNRLK